MIILLLAATNVSCLILELKMQTTELKM